DGGRDLVAGGVANVRRGVAVGALGLGAGSLCNGVRGKAPAAAHGGRPMGQDKGRAVRATIGLAAGGTGGHLFPAEALARELQARGHGVVLYTESRGARFTQALEGLPHEVLPARSLAGGPAGKLAAAVVIARAA